MDNFYIPEGFDEREFVDPSVHAYFKQRGWSCWVLFNPLLLRTVTAIQKLYGKPLINNWHLGGCFCHRGYRTDSCGVGEQFSAHKRGCAVDCSLPGQRERDAVEAILRDPWCEAFEFITFVEINVCWLHLDVTNFDKKKYGIQKIDPLNLGGLYVVK